MRISNAHNQNLPCGKFTDAVSDHIFNLVILSNKSCRDEVIWLHLSLMLSSGTKKKWFH